jgi:homoserine O-succinyltransferase
MTLEIDSPASAPADARTDAPGLVVALINNMPDSAVEGTETQFSSLLRAASGTTPLRLKFTALPEVGRGPAIAARVAERYWPLEAIYRDPPDALIVTGTEPRAPYLPDEPYWGRMVEVMDFAQREVRASAWSCLAAHAVVQRFDGIERRRLPAKRSGVYRHEILTTHPLMQGLAAPLATPHSRWNDLPIDALGDAGYQIISRSSETGADAFVRPGRAPMLFFQGHPEYEERTLLKEYQRDVGRFVAGQQARYPTMPAGYFGPAATDMLARFESDALAGRLADPMASFPFTAVAATLVNSWSASSARLYANWLAQISVGKRHESSRSPRGIIARGLTET